MQRWKSGAVDEVDVEIAVAVIVEEGDSGNECFYLVFIGSGTIGGYKMEAAFRRNFFESNRSGGGSVRALLSPRPQQTLRPYAQQARARSSAEELSSIHKGAKLKSSALGPEGRISFLGNGKWQQSGRPAQSRSPAPLTLECVAQRELNFALIVGQRATDSRPAARPTLIGVVARPPKLRMVEDVEHLGAEL